jgi:hypothetical protein
MVSSHKGKICSRSCPGRVCFGFCSLFVIGFLTLTIFGFLYLFKLRYDLEDLGILIEIEKKATHVKDTNGERQYHLIERFQYGKQNQTCFLSRQSQSFSKKKIQEMINKIKLGTQRKIWIRNNHFCYDQKLKRYYLWTGLGMLAPLLLILSLLCCCIGLYSGYPLCSPLCYCCCVDWNIFDCCLRYGKLFRCHHSVAFRSLCWHNMKPHGSTGQEEGEGEQEESQQTSSPPEEKCADDQFIDLLIEEVKGVVLGLRRVSFCDISEGTALSHPHPHPPDSSHLLKDPLRFPPRMKAIPLRKSSQSIR